MKRKFWWELLFISVLVFLFAGVWSQRKRKMTAVAPVVIVPEAVLTAIVQTPPVLALK